MAIIPVNWTSSLDQVIENSAINQIIESNSLDALADQTAIKNFPVGQEGPIAWKQMGALWSNNSIREFALQQLEKKAQFKSIPEAINKSFPQQQHSALLSALQRSLRPVAGGTTFTVGGGTFTIPNQAWVDDFEEAVQSTGLDQQTVDEAFDELTGDLRTDVESGIQTVEKLPFMTGKRARRVVVALFYIAAAAALLVIGTEDWPEHVESAISVAAGLFLPKAGEKTGDAVQARIDARDPDLRFDEKNDEE